MWDPSRCVQFHRYFRRNCGVPSAPFFDPGGLDGFQDLFVGTARIVAEVRQLQDPAMQVGEAQIDIVGVGMALLQLDGDVLDVGPAQLAGHGNLVPYLSTIMLRVAAGSLTTSPSRASLMRIWQHSREVWVSPKARSSMSSSSSLAGASLSNQSFSTMTWHVEQASEPSQAPSTSTWLRWAISSTER